MGNVIMSIPRDCAPFRANVSSSSRCCGLKITATRFASGATSFSSSIRLAAISSVRNVMPVKFLPGLARDTASPARTGTIADAAHDRDGALACLKKRFDNVTTYCEQKVRLVGNKFLSQPRETRRVAVGITENDLETTSVNQSALRKCIFQRLIDRAKRCAAEYEPSDPKGSFLCECQSRK